MNKPIKLLLCTYYWPPSGGAGVQRSLKFAKYLQEYSVVPTILTVESKSATYPIIDESLSLEIPENIRIVRTKSWEPFGIYSRLSGKKESPQSGFANEVKPGLKEKISRFIRGNFFLPDARRGWNKYALHEAQKLIEKKEIDIVLTSSPPHSSQLIGLKLKTIYHIPWVADLRDPWTDIYYSKQLFPTFLAKHIDAYYERKVLENADKIIVVSKAIKNLFLSKSKKINPDKIIVIPNGFDQSDFEAIPHKKNAVFTIAYTGTIAETYDLSTFALACKTSFVDRKIPFLIRFAGSSRSMVEPLLDKYGLSKFSEILPLVRHRKSIEILQKSDALLLLIPNVKENEGILTGKLFEYLGARKPIIGIGPTDGDAAEIVESCHAGKMIPYGDNRQLSAYLTKLFAQWQADELEVANDRIRNFTRQSQTENLSKELFELLKL
ncbi:MAG TPA: hypothetical protein DCG69_09415 [Bacteroidales bacterium]|nr:hypothetical protein [Bacteroidales bacterium]